MTSQRRLWAGVVLTLLAGLLIAAGLGDAPAGRDPVPAAPQLELAADASQFRAGNIISDGLFFDGLAMNAGDVQAFIADKNRACVPGANPCLRDFRQNTQDLPADSYCRGYAGAPGETPGTIIAKVGESCGISQRVLLVVMQKEQSLLTASGRYLTDRRYAAAMGFKCPDSTAPYCDPVFAGFQRQVYYAARQYKYYAATPSRWNHVAGRWNSILFSPEQPKCGRGDVFIENQATAGLYNYTPYQPNAAALAAGYGTAECGAYGNRNFWLYYTDWFGSTQSPGGTAIVARAEAAGATIGAATSGVICGLAGGGCFRTHQQAAIYWSPSTGAQIVRGAIGGKWGQLGWEYGKLGYPTGEERCGLADDGCFQTFQRGSIYFTPALGAWSVNGSIYNRWAKQTWEHGPLGYPTRDELCGLVGRGCVQTFQGGNVYWSPGTGARIVSAPVLARYGKQNWEKGPLGYPTGYTTCRLRDTGCFHHFQGGSVYSSASAGVRIVSGAVRDKWKAQNWEKGPLGYPTRDTTCGLAGGGCFSTFEHGAVYWSPATGARTVADGPVRDRWTAQQWERGALGYPTGDTTCGLTDGGCSQSFEGGSVYWTTGTGARIVSGAVRTRYTAASAQDGVLGYPTGDQACGLARQGCYQTFQHGLVYTTPTTGTRIMSGAFLTEWSNQSYERGPLGYPTSDQKCGLADGGCYQHFEGGSLYSSTATGLHTVLGPFRNAWKAQKWERGPLGYPTADQVCGLPGGGCSQQFQGGSIIWSPGTGARAMTGQIGGYWAASGAQGGSLGYPTGNQVCGLVGGGCYQQFQGGSVYWTAGTGPHAVSGPIYTAWSQQGWERGALGYPTADATATGSETTQVFQGGTLVLDTTTGKVRTGR